MLAACKANESVSGIGDGALENVTVNPAIVNETLTACVHGFGTLPDCHGLVIVTVSARAMQTEAWILKLEPVLGIWTSSAVSARRVTRPHLCL